VRARRQHQCREQRGCRGPKKKFRAVTQVGEYQIALSLPVILEHDAHSNDTLTLELVAKTV
jgi:hypothetical protein